MSIMREIEQGQIRDGYVTAGADRELDQALQIIEAWLTDADAYPCGNTWPSREYPTYDLEEATIEFLHRHRRLK